MRDFGWTEGKGVCLRLQLVEPKSDTLFPTPTKMGLLHPLSQDLKLGYRDSHNSLWCLEI